VRVVSGRFLARFQEGARLFAPVAQIAAGRAGGFAAQGFAALRGRISRFDATAALIALADAVETVFAGARRAARGVARNRGLGLTGGLAWRCLAALTGIGLTATLVTALSVDETPPRLASLTLTPAQDARAQDIRAAVRDVRQEPRPSPAIGEAWLRIAKPVALIGLESPELDRQPAAYEAQRSPDGARRLDTLVYGGFDGDKPHLQLRMLVERSQTTAQPFVIALVRDAAERGMSVQRSGVPDSVATKFGPLDTADATLSDGSTSRHCIAFRKPPSDGPMTLSGWWCGIAARPADRQQLACLIDRLDLLSAGDDPALRAAFARGELARQPACAPPRLAASGRKASWLDADGKPPALKTAAKR
jgi:hypothetical protein